MTSGPTTQKDGWRVLLTSCPAPPTPKWRNDAVIARCASSGAGIGRDRIPGRRGLCRASRGPLGPAAGVLHIGEGHLRDSMAGFPHDSAVHSRMSVLSGEAPMCRGDRSAHGRASTALSAGAFPHDSANPPPAGPARMCNTARPGPTPHIQVWPRSPRTHFWHRPGRTTRGRPPRPTRGRWLSKSATKTPTEPERARRNVDIPRLRSPSIPPQGAFVADSDTPPPRVTTGATPAPSFQRPAATNLSKEQRRLASGSPFLIIRVHRPE